MSTACIDTPRQITVGMGEIAIATHPDLLYSVLGSCIGVALVDVRRKVAGLAHVVLPASSGRPGPPGKFADTAIPHMLTLLAAKGARTTGLLVKITGGSQMFQSSGPLQIGQANADAVRKALRDCGLAVQVEDIGGCEGRRVELECITGRLIVSRVGQPDLVL